LFQPLSHFSGGFVGKGNRHDVVGANAAKFNQIGDPMGNHSGLAAAGSSQDKYRSFYGFHSFSLGGIKRG
jgi:hypothetical protein